MARPQMYTPEELKERKATYQREYMKKRYNEDEEFREYEKERKSSSYIKNGRPAGRPKNNN